MVKVYVLRGVLASGEALIANTVADISDSDAVVLTRMGKVRVLPPDPPAPRAQIEAAGDAPEADEPAVAPTRETATRSRRRKATLP